MAVALVALALVLIVVDEQREFAARVGLHYRLISDPARRLASTLELPTFTASGRTFYRRVTLVAQRGEIVKIDYPVTAPEENAAQVVAWLESRSAGSRRQ
jgi:peroxiredoxin